MCDSYQGVYERKLGGKHYVPVFLHINNEVSLCKRGYIQHEKTLSCIFVVRPSAKALINNTGILTKWVHVCTRGDLVCYTKHDIKHQKIRILWSRHWSHHNCRHLYKLNASKSALPKATWSAWLACRCKTRTHVMALQKIRRQNWHEIRQWHFVGKKEGIQKSTRLSLSHLVRYNMRTWEASITIHVAKSQVTNEV